MTYIILNKIYAIIPKKNLIYYKKLEAYVRTLYIND